MDNVLEGWYKIKINKSKARVIEFSLRKSCDLEDTRLGNETLKVIRISLFG